MRMQRSIVALISLVLSPGLGLGLASANGGDGGLTPPPVFVNGRGPDSKQANRVDRLAKDLRAKDQQKRCAAAEALGEIQDG